jgi:cell division protein FtsQ
MKINFNIKREIKVVAAISVLFFFIGFSERKQTEVAVVDIIIKIENTLENHLLDENDVIKLMQLNEENLKGASISKINLKAIEKRIKSNTTVKDAQLYSDLKGNLIVKATLHKPIARIVRNDAPDKYIAEDGTIMPVSDKFTTRVVLISGAYARQLIAMGSLEKTDEGKQLLEMLHIIREDDFWRAQIAQLDIGGKGYIHILPQVGNQVVEFGKAENLELKFKKLRVFYKDILPQMGWNKYQRVNLEYGNQIIAE